MIIMRHLIFLLGLYGTVSQAAPIATPSEYQTDLTQDQLKQAERKDAVSASSNKPSVSFSSQEFLNHPELLQNALDTAISQQNTGNIRFLLPLYRQLPAEQQDKVLGDYAETFILREDGRYTEAEKRLRAILAEHSDFAPVRLQLAHTLSQNGQQREAAKEVTRLRQTSDLPTQVKTHLDQFDRHLKTEQDWKFDANASYIRDNNVGRVPEQRTYGNWQFSEPKSAHGIAYDVSAQKTVPLNNHWAARLQASSWGKFYWDAHDYDDLIIRSEIGGVWRNAKQEASLAPFFEKRWYGTEPYSHHSGAILRYSRLFSPTFQLYTAWQSGYKKHQERTYLDGAGHSLSVTLVKHTSPRQSLFYGIDGGLENARDLSEAYRRYGVRAGWHQTWGKSQNINTAVQLATQRRHYRAPDFFNIQRRDTEYTARAWISNQNLSWLGFTPRLNWSWSHTKSNHFYYRHNRHQVFIDVSKKF